MKLRFCWQIATESISIIDNNYLLVVRRIPIAVMHQCYHMIGVHKMMVGHSNSFLYKSGTITELLAMRYSSLLTNLMLEVEIY